MDALEAAGNYDQAIDLLSKHADRGDQGALYNLGLIWVDGLTGRPDFEKAASYFRQAAIRGHAKAQLALARQYRDGIGVFQNSNEAAGWYRRAARQGILEAQTELAQLLDRDSDRASRAESESLFKEAALAGSVMAKRHFQRMHRIESIQTPELAKVQLASFFEPALSILDQHDELARLAKIKVNTLIHAASEEAQIKRAGDDYDELEAELDRRLDSTWKSVQLDRGRPVLVADPLRLAFLNLHIETRRRLGPNHHTQVEGLVADPGCKGDVVGDRLLVKYARNAIQRIMNDGEVSAEALSEVEVLERFAMQVSCLSSRQLANLEEALVKGSAKLTLM